MTTPSENQLETLMFIPRQNMECERGYLCTSGMVIKFYKNKSVSFIILCHQSKHGLMNEIYVECKLCISRNVRIWHSSREWLNS